VGLKAVPEIEFSSHASPKKNHTEELMKKTLLLMAFIYALHLGRPAFNAIVSLSQAQEEPAPKPEPKPKPKPEPDALGH
jgi:hypothetical protein